MKRFLLWILVLLITACALVGTNDPVNPSSPFERRTASEVANDRDIENDINEELGDDNDLQSQTHINVNAYNGIVLLTGQAMTAELKTKIVEIARVVKHVKQVNDNITVSFPSGIDSINNDRLMTERITIALQQIRSLPNFDSSQVKVIIVNSSVYLMGLVHRSEGAVVINVVRHQVGVKQIITVFEYLD